MHPARVMDTSLLSTVTPPRQQGVGRRALGVAAILVLAAVTFAGVRLYVFVTSAQPPVPVVPPAPLRALSNLRPVSVTTTTPEWKKVPETVTVDRLRTDHTLWRRMHVGDWDEVPREFRAPALRAMIRAYEGLFDGPAVWRRMGVDEWDRVPQPIRAMAYLRMIWHWAREERLGAEFDRRPRALAPSVAAIVMAESWFEHRAVNENQWGNRDLGLAQCSDYCRATLQEMAASGEIPFALEEDDFFNPWLATRVATVWFERELLRADGDVDLAIRAYHRGIDNAMDDKGDRYHARVVRLRRRYITTQEASRAWAFLTEQIRPL